MGEGQTGAIKTNYYFTICYTNNSRILLEVFAFPYLNYKVTFGEIINDLFNILVSQRVPVNPAGHEQLNEATPSVQVPPF